MVKNQALSVLLLFLMLANHMPGMGVPIQRHHPIIHGDVATSASWKTLNATAEEQSSKKMWCCEESSCEVLRGLKNYLLKRHGVQYSRHQIIGAKCNGTALNLTQSCKGGCNFYPEDKARNYRGILRSHSPCNINQTNTTLQCIPEHDDRNDKLQCQDRGNHQPFQTSIENSHFFDPERILTPCKTSDGIGG